jgi:hypothetical protein
MRKSSLQAAHKSRKLVQKLRTKCMQFSAASDLSTFVVSCTQVCARVMRQIVHIVQHVFTEVMGKFSPLSTALIKSNNMEIKN